MEGRNAEYYVPSLFFEKARDNNTKSIWFAVCNEVTVTFLGHMFQRNRS